jgi:hypothetical protein
LAGGEAAQEPELAKAKAEAESLRALVEAGAAPRAQLERSQARIADAEDAAELRRTVYGADLTEGRIPAMLDAANRRLERRRLALEKQQKLVSEGAASQFSLVAFREEIDLARKESEMAESRAELCRELTTIARSEQELATQMLRAPEEAHTIAERYDGYGVFTQSDFARVEAAFAGHFARGLPVSAMGETAVHRALGFDHRNRVDVAVHPDQPEGVWLRQYLELHHIPYFAFRRAVAGKATGAHIHIGPMSTPLARAGLGGVNGS